MLHIRKYLQFPHIQLIFQSAKIYCICTAAVHTSWLCWDKTIPVNKAAAHKTLNSDCLHTNYKINSGFTILAITCNSSPYLHKASYWKLALSKTLGFPVKQSCLPLFVCFKSKDSPEKPQLIQSRKDDMTIQCCQGHKCSGVTGDSTAELPEVPSI